MHQYDHALRFHRPSFSRPHREPPNELLNLCFRPESTIEAGGLQDLQQARRKAREVENIVHETVAGPVMKIDLESGRFLGAMESPGHHMGVSDWTGEIFIGSLTGIRFARIRHRSSSGFGERRRGRGRGHPTGPRGAPPRDIDARPLAWTFAANSVGDCSLDSKRRFKATIHGDAIDPSSWTGRLTNGLVPWKGYFARTASLTSIPRPGFSESG